MIRQLTSLLVMVLGVVWSSIGLALVRNKVLYKMHGFDVIRIANPWMYGSLWLVDLAHRIHPYKGPYAKKLEESKEQLEGTMREAVKPLYNIHLM